VEDDFAVLVDFWTLRSALSTSDIIDGEKGVECRCELLTFLTVALTIDCGGLNAMFPRIKRLSVLILSLTVFACLGLKAESQPQNDAMPPLAGLKKLDYTRSAEGRASDDMGYSALRDFINACKAYSRGLSVLPNFHEPVISWHSTEFPRSAIGF